VRLGRTGERAEGRTGEPLTAAHWAANDLAYHDPSARPAVRPSALYCQRCTFPVPARAMGCKNPCPNCGTVYPLGDCSD